MANVRRVNARDIAQAGSVPQLITKLLEDVRTGNMEIKERAAMFLRSLTEQPKAVGQEVENVDLIARPNSIKALVTLTIIGSPVAQKHACAALANIANGKTNHQEAVVEAGGVLPIATALRGGDSGLQVQAAFAVACVSQLEASRKHFIKVGAIPSLVKLLKDASADTQVHASMALANLSENNPEAQTSIAKTGAMRLLIDQLGSGKSQEAVAHALARLTYRHEANQAEVTRLQGIPKLVALLNVVNAEAQARAAEALAAIASTHIRQDADSPSPKDRIAEAGGIRPLLSLVETRYTHTQRSAINAVAMIATNHYDNQNAIATMGGIVPLVHITQAGGAYPADVQEQTVLALTEIARHNHKNQSSITHIGAIQSLVNLMRHSNSPKVEAEVAGAFWALSENHDANKVLIAQATAIPVIMPQIGSQGERAQVNAANAIASLSLSNEANQAESTNLLVGLLEDANAGTVSRAAELLWRMVHENPDSKLVIAKAGAAEALVRLLHNKQPRAKAYALWSLSLSIDGDNQKRVADAGGIKPLVQMLNSRDIEVNEQAACAIQLLAQDNADTQMDIAKQGAVEPLIALLDSGDSEQSQLCAAAALSDLALIPANKVSIDRGGGIQPLVGLLSDSRPRGAHSKKYAAAALARLSADEADRQAREELEKQLLHQEALQRKRRQQQQQQQQLSGEEVESPTRRRAESRVSVDGDEGRQSPPPSPQLEVLPTIVRKMTKAETIAAAGAIGPLVDLLRGNLGAEAQEEGAHALWALADVSTNRKSITEHGGIGPLVELLGCQNSKARQHAEGALVRLSIEDVNRVLIIKQLVEMLQESSGIASQEQAAAALANLARESTDNRTSILEAGGIPRLLALLKNTSAHKAKENAVSAVAQLAYKNPANQDAIAEADGIPALVATLSEASSSSKEHAMTTICTLAASAIWHVAEHNANNQTMFFKEGAIPHIVGLLGNLTAEMQTNAAGALAALARDHADNQGAIARANAIASLCTMVREAQPETREEAAAAIWALASNNAPNKATIAKLGGIEPLVNMLTYATTENSSINAAGALAALAKQHSDNCATITKRMVSAISAKSPAARAVRLLSAVATMCDNEAMNQIAMAKMSGIQPLIPWLENPAEEVQVQAARALLAVCSNNATTQSLVGNLGAIKPLVGLVANGILAAQENAACALWHLATLSENRVRIAQADGLPPLVGMLISEGELAPQIASMTLLRLAEGSTKAASKIAHVGGIKPLVVLLDTGTIATQQMAAACLAAIAAVWKNRDAVCDAGGVRPLIKLLDSDTLGTPETAARALGCLARNDGDDVDVVEKDPDFEEVAQIEAAGEQPPAAGVPAAAEESSSEVAATAERTSGPDAEEVESSDDDDASVDFDRQGGELRRTAIKNASGVASLIAMLDGSNLCGKENVLKPPVVGGWAALRIGVEGCIMSKPIFPGSQVDFGVRMGMQEQAASTLSDLAHGDTFLQDAILEHDGVPPLLSLVRSGTQQAQEFAARALWYLASMPENQRTIVDCGAVVDLVQLLKNCNPTVQYAMPAAAALAELAYGAVLKREAEIAKRAARRGSMALDTDEDPATSPEGHRMSTMRMSATEVPPAEAVADEESMQNPSSNDEEEAERRPMRISHRLTAINEAGGIIPLVKICEGGTPEGKEKAAAAMWHLALDRDNQTALAANGAIKPLVALLADGTPDAKNFASKALTRLATKNPDNQAQIAKRLVGLLDHDDSDVVSLAARDLQALASHPGAPIVIVNAGAISPLVSVLSNGKTDVGRNQAAKTLHTLANSGPANQLAIAIGLVALLGVGSDQAQEYVTQLLLTLTSGGADADEESVKTNRRAIANAGPFRMLVMQLRSESGKVRMLASAVLSKLSGDSEQNVTEIANSKGISPLVALLAENDEQTQQNSTFVLADMARVALEHAAHVAEEGGIPLLVKLLSTSSSIDTKSSAADTLGSVAIEHALQVGSSGAIIPLVKLIGTSHQHAQKAAARALAGIAAGGKENQDGVKDAGGVELLVDLLKKRLDVDTVDVTASRALEEVKSRAAGALCELARSNASNQLAITACGGIQPLIQLVTESSEDQPKVDAASTLWSLSDKNYANQKAIADAGGIDALVKLVGQCASEEGQLQASGAIASLALDNEDNLKTISALLVSQLADATLGSDTREKSARAISHFARAHPSNQDELANAGGITLIVSQLNPQLHQEKAASVGSTGMLGLKSDANAADANENHAKRHLTQKELAASLWSITHHNGLNQKAVARAGGIPLLIAMLTDHPEIRRDAAGALWSLGADSENQRLIAEADGIPKVVDLLKPGKNNTAQDTAAGALESLASRPENRVLIADSDGISLLIPLFEGGCSDGAKRSVAGALLTLAIDNASNQFNIINKLVALLTNGPESAQKVLQGGNEEMKSRVEAQEHATRVLHTMTLERDHREAISRTQAIGQLVRQLKGGTDASQQLASSALTQIARMSSDLRIQVTQQLVTLLGDPDADVRQRAGTALRENNNSEGGSEDSKHQKEAVMAGGVAPLVELLKAGLSDDRVEAQEYSLWSLTLVTDPMRRKHMVEEEAIPALIQSLKDGKLREDSKEHAAMVLACLALDAGNHAEMVEKDATTQLVRLLASESSTVEGRKQAALGLARLSYHDSTTQTLIADTGAIQPLVQWLADPSLGPPDVGALCLADLARHNPGLQVRIADEGAIPLIVDMLVSEARTEVHVAACQAAANLARDMPTNQEAIALAGGIIPMVKLLTMDPCKEQASNAISTLATHPDNKMQIFRAGGIPPLVRLLWCDNPTTQQHTARAMESLARDCIEIQDALAAEGATGPLVNLLASESTETQESAVGALLCLAAHPESRTEVVERVVGVLMQRNTAAQLKAADALAVLAARSSLMRTAIVYAGAIEPLVQLLGNGMRSEKNTPPERAAAVLADLSRFGESKAEITRIGGIEPLVQMLSSSCEDARKHASCALRHLSATQDGKVQICQLEGIEKCVELLSDTNADAQRHAAQALWQLATSTESKATIVEVGGIKPLVELMRDVAPSEEMTRASKERTGVDSAPGSLSEPSTQPVRSPEAKEAAVAMLSELARSQGENRSDIVKAGGVEPMVELLCHGTPAAQKYATCALWGISQESKHRQLVATSPGAIAQLVDLLRNLEGETQGFAASTLVCLAQDKAGKDTIMSVGGAGPLMAIAMGPMSWLRTRSVEVLRLLGYPDPLAPRKDGSVPSTEAKPISPRLAKYQTKLAKNPAIWMVPDEGTKQLITDEHMADLACKIREGDRVIVDPGNRKAEVRFVGKIPEIAKGYWVGVQYDDPVGRNDGSVKGRRCFECTHDFGGFLRPNHIRVDLNPPIRKGSRPQEADAIDHKPQEGKTRKSRKPKASSLSDDAIPVEPIVIPSAHTASLTLPSEVVVEPSITGGDADPARKSKRAKQGQVVLATKVTRPTEIKLAKAGGDGTAKEKDSPRKEKRAKAKK